MAGICISNGICARVFGRFFLPMVALGLVFLARLSDRPIFCDTYDDAAANLSMLTLLITASRSGENAAGLLECSTGLAEPTWPVPDFFQPFS